MMRFAQNAAKTAKYRLNLKRADRFTAEIAIDQKEDSKVSDHLVV